PGARAGDGRGGAPARALRLHARAPRCCRRGDVPPRALPPGGGRAVRVLPLVSCRGWSSDAYWAAAISVQPGRAGHDVTLVCKQGSEERVIRRARAAGARRIETLRFASGLKPATDGRDVRQLMSWLDGADVVHVHRGKEHWLAAVANRLS